MLLPILSPSPRPKLVSIVFNDSLTSRIPTALLLDPKRKYRFHFCYRRGEACAKVKRAAAAIAEAIADPTAAAGKYMRAPVFDSWHQIYIKYTDVASSRSQIQIPLLLSPGRGLRQEQARTWRTQLRRGQDPDGLRSGNPGVMALDRVTHQQWAFSLDRVSYAFYSILFASSRLSFLCGLPAWNGRPSDQLTSDIFYIYNLPIGMHNGTLGLVLAFYFLPFSYNLQFLIFQEPCSGFDSRRTEKMYCKQSVIRFINLSFRYTLLDHCCEHK